MTFNTPYECQRLIEVVDRSIGQFSLTLTSREARHPRFEGACSSRRQLMNKMIGIVAVAVALALGACAETKSSQSTGAYLDDTVITTKVKTAILEDPALKVMQIQVETNQNVVQLSGFVDSQQMAMRAGTVASRVEGVSSVRNDLIVK